MTVSGYCVVVKVIKGSSVRMICTLPKGHDGMHRAAYHWKQDDA